MQKFKFQPRAFSRDLRRRIGLSRAFLWVERLAVALWPAFAVICLALSAALLGGYELLGATGHRVALGLTGGLLLAALVYGFWRFARPAQPEALARLDRTDPGRPLAAMTDKLAAGEGETAAQVIWRTHLERATAAAEALRPEPPDLRLSRWDRWGLRLFAPALLIAAFIGTGGAVQERLTETLKPRPPASETTGIVLADAMAEAWAIPPAYTGRETVYLGRTAPDAPFDLPQGSELTLRVTGAETAPVLAGEGLSGLSSFADLGGGLYEATGLLERSGRVTVSVGEEPLADWEIAVIPDLPPEIEFASDPRANPTRSLEVPFAARDDYGVIAAWAEITLTGDAGKGLPVEPIEFALPLPISADPRNVADTAVRDLIAHPWAGAEVEIVLKAEDGAGNVAATEPRRFTLPERRWFNPLAWSFAEQRRGLVLDYGDAPDVLDMLQALVRWPDEVFEDRTGVYLTVRLAIRRLAVSLGRETVPAVAPDVIELLWLAAIGLEDGDLSSALERLRQAEERLRQALENGTDEDIRAALDALRQAMNEYLQQLAQQGMQAQPDGQPMDPNAPQISQQDLEEMLNELQRQAESGLRDQARDMLSQLSQMLQNLQSGQQQARPGGQGQQALQQLQEMIQRQRDLSDETFNAMREGQRGGQRRGQRGQRRQQPGQQPGQQPAPGSGQGGQGGERSGSHLENGRLAAEQEALRQAIEELRDQLGGGEGMDGASRALDEAGRAMEEAQRDLEGGSLGDAVRDQMEALQRLDEGADALAEAVQNGQGDTAARGAQDGEGRVGDNLESDPFDRPSGRYGEYDGRATKVPDRSVMDRARELMNELRRRSAEQERPQIELDYFKRLLDQF